MGDLFDRIGVGGPAPSTAPKGDLFSRLSPDEARVAVPILRAGAAALKPTPPTPTNSFADAAKSATAITGGIGSNIAPRTNAEMFDPNNELPQQALKAPVDTWRDTGRKARERVLPLVKGAVGGALQMATETAPEQIRQMGQTSGPGQIVAKVLDVTGILSMIEKVNAGQREAGTLPGQEMSRLAADDLAKNEYAPGDSNAKRYAGMLSDSLVLMAPAVAASFATKNPYVAGAVMGGAVAGQQYGDSREDGRTIKQAAIDATWMGVSEALGEEIPLGILMKPGGKFLKRAAKAVIGESAQEVITQILQTGYDKGVLHPDMTWGEAAQQVVDAGIVGGLMGGSLSVATAPFHGAEEEAPPRQFTPGIRETAAAEAATLTPEDDASPIPNEIIAAGKATVAAATASDQANEVLAPHGAPEVGKRVTVTLPDGSKANGIVDDAYVTDAGAAGQVPGIKIKMDDGKLLDEHLDTLAEAGITITPALSPLAEADAIGAQLKAMADAPIEGAPPSLAALNSPNLDRGTRSLKPTRVKPSGALDLGIVKFFEDKGYSPAQARGIAAGVAAESANNHGALNQSSGAMGLGQWLGDRKRRLIERYGQNPTREQQLEFLHSELQGGDAGGKHVRGARTDAEALDAYIRKFMRPAAGAETDGDIARGMAALGQKGVPAPSGNDSRETSQDEPLPAAQVDAQPDPAAFVPTGDGSRTAPASVATADHMGAAVEQVAPAPTDAQKEAGNYRKAHVNVQGLDIAIENPKGSERSGTDPNGKPWAVTMPDHYGYVKRTTGADGDQVDVYVGPQPDAPQVYVVDQKDADTGKFDEHKAMIGYSSKVDALVAYNQAFSDGRGAERVGNVTEMPMDGFKEWLKGDTTKPAADLEEHPGLVIHSLRSGKETTIQPHGTRAPSVRATVADMPSGKSVIIKSATPEQLAAIRKAIPNAQPMEPKGGGVVYSKKYEKQIRAALKPAKREVGRNYLGDRLMEDDNGVRTIVDSRGIGMTESVGIVPTRGGGIEVHRQPRVREYLTAEEDNAQPVAREGRTAGEDRAQPPASPAPSGPRVMINFVGRDGMTDAERGGPLPKPETTEPASNSASSPETAGVTSTGARGEARAPVSSVRRETNKKNPNPFVRTGEHYRFLKRVDYLGGNPETTYTVERAGVRDAYFRNEDGSGSATQNYNIERALRDGSLIRVEDVTSLAAQASPSSELVSNRDELPSTYGAKNKLVTKDRAAEIREKLRAKLNQLNSGIDPEALAMFTELGVFHIEAGARRFTDFAKAVVADLGVSFAKARPFLRSAYNGARDMMEDMGASVVGMDGPEEVATAMRTFGDWASDSTDAPQSATGSSQDVTDAQSEPVDGNDRNGPEGPSAEGVSAIEGQRPVEVGAGGSSADGLGDVQSSPRGTAGQGDAAIAEPVAGGQGERGGAGREPGRELGDRAGNRVPARPSRTGRGSDYLAPAGSLTREGSWLATASRNLDIIELVNALEAEGRAPTAAEQATLAKFTGWGAGEIANNLFKGVDRKGASVKLSVPEWERGEWPDLRRRAVDLLKGDDLATAMRSTQYAHYTSEDVIRSMWDAVQGMGFAGGRVLEPGAGIGLFMAAAPENIAKSSSYVGIEMDGFTAKVGQLLLPQQTVNHADFTKIKLPNGFFDVAIGNPPFSSNAVLNDPEYRRHRLSLHDYFFAKSIDKVRVGGLMVFVTSRYTMDKLNDKGRAYIAERADLLGAVRLPQTAFKANAGTEVVTDILFFQRRAPGVEAGGAAWAKADKIPSGPATGKDINEYFIAHPEMVLGEHAIASNQFEREGYTVKPSDTPIAELLAAAVAKLPKDVYTETARQTQVEVQAKSFEADLRPSAEKEGALYVAADGNVFVRENGVGVRVEQLDDKLTADNVAWLKSYAGVRDALKVAQRDQLSDGDWEVSLKALNKTYDAFVKKHGPIQAHTVSERVTVDDDGNETTRIYKRFKNQKLFNLDVEYPLLLTLETIKDGGIVEKGPFLSGRSLNRPKVLTIESAQDALAVTLNDIGRFNLGYAAKLANKTEAEMIAALGDAIYQAPDGVWQTSDEYLSGDVVAKLEEARTAAGQDKAFERNVEGLEKVQPNPLGPAEITLKLGSGWIPMAITRGFANDIVGIEANSLAYEVTTAEWAMDMAGSRSSRRIAASSDYGTVDQSAQEIFLKVLNNQSIKVVRRNSDGSTHVDPEATALANQKAKEMAERFQTWAWEDTGRAHDLLELYNRRFNNLAPRSFDGSHLTTPGLAARYKLFPHQKRAIWRVIQTGNTYLAHAVGAGKTLEMIVAGMEQRRIGLIRKPMYVVPNHMLNQFSSEFMEAYPAANIMIADERNFHTDNRKRFMAQAALNDPDAIIITHSALNKIDLQDESRQIVLDKMIDELTAALATSDNRYTTKKIEKQIEALTSRFQGKASSEGKDKALTFEEMGVDQLIVDEAHEFRKLDFATNRAVKGIDQKGSNRALDLYIKTRWLEANNPGRSLVMASGTPVTNTMAEIYTVMRYMNESALEEDGLRAFDAWANMFGEVATGYEQNAAGGYDIVERFAKFVNVPELMSRVRTFMDVLTSSQLGDLVARPDVVGGQPENVVSPPIDTLRTFMDTTLARRIAATRAWKPSKDQPNNPDPIIAINGDALLSSIDMRFINPDLPSDPGSKLNVMLSKIVDRHAAINAIHYTDPKSGKPEAVKGGTQIVFSAVGFGEQAQKNRGFDLRGHVEKTLIAGGLKKAQIAWMSDANTHAKKEQVFKDMRAGKVRVLFGSPKNMGTGVNVQNRLKALHFLSPPWYPSDVEQPHGRIIRQGNWNKEVNLYWYATKGTYDSTAWGMVSRKARFIEQALSGDNSVRKIEDVSEVSQYEMAEAMAAGDERVMAVTGLNGDLTRLTRLQSAHAQTQRDLVSERRTLNDYGLPAAKRDLADIRSALKARDANAPFALTVDGRTYDKQNEAGEALIAKALATPTEGALGKYQGHEISHVGEGGRATVELKVGNYAIPIVKYSALPEQSPGGMGAKIANAVARLPSDERAAQAHLDTLESQMAAIERKIGAPFPQAGELAEKTAELARLQSEIAADSKVKEEEAKKLLADDEEGKVAEPSGQGYDPSHEPDAPTAEAGSGTDVPVRGNQDAVPVRGRNPVRALGIAAAIDRGATEALIGREIGHYSELAELAQIYRDPRYETFRVFFVKNGVIAHATGVSARMSSEAPLMPDGKSGQFADWLKATMASSEADGYYLLHNHPSGDPTPSRADSNVTAAIAALVPGYRGHVVINSTKFATIDAQGVASVRNLLQPKEDHLLKPSKPHPVLGELVNTAAALARIAKEVQQSGYVTLIAADAKLQVRAIADYPASELERPDIVLMAALRRLMRRSGSSDVFIVGERDAINHPSVRNAVRKGLLIEGIDDTGSYLSHMVGRGSTKDRPAPFTANSGRFVAEEREAYAGGIPGPFARTSDDASASDENATVDMANTLGDSDPSTVAGGSRFDKWRTAMQDRMLPLLRVQQAIEQATGKPLDESENPYIGEELMTGRVGAQLERLADEMVSPLFMAMKEEGVSKDELESYLYARHAPERNARISEINPEFAEDEGSGMTDAEAAQIMEAVEESGKMPALERLAERIDAMTAFSVDTRFEAGLLSKKEAAAWRKQYEFYVPLRGRGDIDAETPNPARPMKGSGISVKGSESRRAFGRKSRAGDIIAYTVMQAEEAIIRSETNRVGQQFMELAKANPDPSFWSVDKVERRPVWDKASSSVVYENQRRISADDAPFTISLKTDGVEHRVTLNRDNPAAVRVADSMRNLSAQQLQPWVKYIGAFTRLFSRINTSLNPEFVITNALRDVQTAGVNLQQYDKKGLVTGTLRDWRKALVATKSGTGEWATWRKEFELAGGKMYFAGLSDLNTIKDRIERLAAKGDKLSLKTAGHAVIDTINTVNDQVENAVRLSAYANARRAGMTQTQAASLARNVTVNFTRRGTYGPVINSLYAFFNAGVQGSATLMIAAGRSKKVRAALVGFVVLGFLTDMLNRWAGDDDKDGESYWDKVPNYEKEKNLIVMLPGAGGKYAKVPLGLGLNAFFSLGRNLSEIAHGRSALEAGGEAFTTALDAFNPLGNGSLLTTLLPTVMDPIAELATNRNFAGKKIQPEPLPFGEKQPASERYFPNVSTTSRKITSWLNSLTGGDDVIEGKVSVSPEVLDYLGAYFAGGAGRFVGSLGNLAAAPFDPERELSTSDIPFARKVVGAKSEWMDKSVFYDRAGQVEQAVLHAKSYEDGGDPERVRAYVDGNRPLFSLEGIAKAAKKEMRDIRKARAANEGAHDRGQIDDARYRAEAKGMDSAEAEVVTTFNAAWNKAMLPASER